MNKKAQFYIFIAILLLTYAFAIARPSAAPKEPVPVFKSLYQNFISESPTVINNALHSSGNVSDAYKNFVDTFISFAKTKEPNFRLLYILVNNDKLVVSNRMDSAINATVNQNSYQISSNQELTLGKADSADIIIGTNTYSFSFDDTDTQVKALFRKEDKNEVRVYVYD